MPQPTLITPGDPAGIGPEIALKALAHNPDLRSHTVMMGDEAHLQSLAESLDLSVRFSNWELGASLASDSITLLPLSWPAKVVSGQPDVANADTIIAAIAQAVSLAQKGTVSGIVTCPIAKSLLYDVGFAFPGHTEYLGSLSQTGHGPIMMLANTELRVVPATIHIALQEVPNRLDKTALTSLICRVSEALQRDFGISKPHIAICGLNPHAGEQGRMGQEEETVIAPAITDAQDQIGDTATISGPHAADSLFHKEKRQHFDCVIGMYHDQVLIPLKTIDFHGGVNITLGLDFVRTSPDHGTAFDIAGQGIANETSLVQAIKVASDLGERRHHHG